MELPAKWSINTCLNSSPSSHSSVTGRCFTKEQHVFQLSYLSWDPWLPHTCTAAAHGCVWMELSVLIGKLLCQAFYLMVPGGWCGGGGGAADVAALHVVFLAEACWCNRAITFFVIWSGSWACHGAASTLTDYRRSERGCRSVIS